MEEIKRAFMTACATDALNAFDQFVAQQFRCMLDGVRICIRSAKHIRQLLRVPSWMETMTVEQLLTQAQAIMTDDKEHEEPVAVST